MSEVNEANQSVDPPDDGGNRPSPSHDGLPARDEPVGEFGDDEQSDAGGDSDVEPKH
jgi:hypothetical protein